MQMKSRVMQTCEMMKEKKLVNLLDAGRDELRLTKFVIVWTLKLANGVTAVTTIWVYHIVYSASKGC